MQKGNESKAKYGGGRKSLLIDYVDKQVNVLTNDGRNVLGSMRGFDQVCNIILEKCFERVFSRDCGVQVVSLGVHVIRGDNIAVIGEVDVEKDQKIAWESMKVCSFIPFFFFFSLLSAQIDSMCSAASQPKIWSNSLLFGYIFSYFGLVYFFCEQGVPLDPVVH